MTKLKTTAAVCALILMLSVVPLASAQSYGSQSGTDQSGYQSGTKNVNPSQGTSQSQSGIDQSKSRNIQRDQSTVKEDSMDRSRLPRTASNLPLFGLIGLLSLGVAFLASLAIKALN